MTVSMKNTAEFDAWGGFKPDTAVKDGVARFVELYRRHHAN